LHKKRFIQPVHAVVRFLLSWKLIKHVPINVVQLIYVTDGILFVRASEARFDVANTCRQTAKSCSEAASQVEIHGAYTDVIYLPEIAATFRLINPRVALRVKTYLQ